MQKSGLGKWTRILCAILVLSLAVLATLVTRAVPKHQFVMTRLERAFSQIEHPNGSVFLQHYTHFGGGTISGSGYDACHYYVADVRSIPGSFEDIDKYYRAYAPYLRGEAFSDIRIEVLPVSEESVFISRDFPIIGWIEEFIKNAYKGIPAYIVYVVKIDENAAGDFRCW